MSDTKKRSFGSCHKNCPMSLYVVFSCMITTLIHWQLLKATRARSKALLVLGREIIRNQITSDKKVMHSPNCDWHNVSPDECRFCFSNIWSWFFLLRGESKGPWVTGALENITWKWLSYHREIMFLTQNINKMFVLCITSLFLAKRINSSGPHPLCLPLLMSRYGLVHWAEFIDCNNYTSIKNCNLYINLKQGLHLSQ